MTRDTRPPPPGPLLSALLRQRERTNQQADKTRDGERRRRTGFADWASRATAVSPGAAGWLSHLSHASLSMAKGSQKRSRRTETGAAQRYAGEQAGRRCAWMMGCPFSDPCHAHLGLSGQSTWQNTTLKTWNLGLHGCGTAQKKGIFSIDIFVC